MEIKFELPQMQKGERMEVFLRKHIMFLVAPLSSILAIMILPLVGIMVLFNLSPFFSQAPIRNLLIIFMSGYLLVMCGYALMIWFRYYYSYLIVTNMRLIEIEQKSLFDRSTSELELVRIEDVKALVRGILATFLRYGDVLVETAGATTENFLFEKIPNASYVSTKILELSQKALDEHTPEIGGRMASVLQRPQGAGVGEQVETGQRPLEGPTDGLPPKQPNFYSNVVPPPSSSFNQGTEPSSPPTRKDSSLQEPPVEKDSSPEEQPNEQKNKTNKNFSKVLYERKEGEEKDISGFDEIDSN